ncbi:MULTISPECIES: S1 RNA-binding domain-containing protein [Planktothrix]|jgi:small subunit ribosomal protein S1|uniref:30S ribosomal protein S1 n=3 Tax=Planktothrix TaxID=54304 RepID=A0A1J1JBP5_PLAAG|nr:MULTISPECIES: S1 RNA-binding domain-containing protein [Planktothrix]MCF3606604.1 S1 RNA-binding domain-containing protein [Planktothrix agardhii 1033]CAD5960183.1 30S ribosomal protein S1 [Planktothrix rubescens]BBD56588.1 30S ribosomal protein S1 [Planktothrix agardhii NIES-204]MBG0747512.1 S1 RNA-binding domain-containing protein [Planktothrix agardhii KL2]MCB8750800.1 S1 RNA-binding domain-containing protein [Planktothrix agardhii 1810]
MATKNPSFSLDDFAKALDQQNYDLHKGQIVKGQVESYTSDGAYIDIKGAKSPGFIPKKEISIVEVEDVSEILPLKEERDFLIIREQNADGQILLSIRQLEMKQIWDQLLDAQNGGQSLQARVTGVNRGGVTVEVHSLRGFIPRSHLLEKDDLDSLVDQSLSVSILELDPERNKIVLSQRLASQSIGFSQLEVGQLVEGKVMGVKPFGVFVDIEGVTGLIHIKEVSQKYVESLPTLFPVGNFIKAMVISLDEGRHRISLSTRILENYPGEVVEKLSEVMESAEARSERAKKLIIL